MCPPPMRGGWRGAVVWVRPDAGRRKDRCAMSSNQNNNPSDNVTFISPVLPIDAAIENESGPPPAGNDNATRSGVLDTTHFLASPDVVAYIRATLRRYGVTPQDMAEAVADVQADAIQAARAKRMPANRAE